MGAIKAGVTIVAFSEKDSIDALNSTLKNSECRGMLFSPQTDVDTKNEVFRETFLKKLMPELNKLYPGDPLDLKNYPHLK